MEFGLNGTLKFRCVFHRFLLPLLLYHCWSGVRIGMWSVNNTNMEFFGGFVGKLWERDVTGKWP